MADPHRKSRYGQQWPANEIHVLGGQVELLAPYVVISGGWAWHLMSPYHVDYKHAHDLKDIDCFVHPTRITEFVIFLKSLGYTREKTKYDHMSAFYRFVRHVDDPHLSETTKVVLDIFIAVVPFVNVGHYCIVEPLYLLSLYGKHNPDSRLHGSGQCWSVQNAQKLVDQGESPILHLAMADFTEYFQ